MRFRAPAREGVDPSVFGAPLFDGYRRWHDWLAGPHWPRIDALNIELARQMEASGLPRLRFVEQQPALLADGLHYETRIAECHLIACRPRNWHDLLNALAWLRHPRLKCAMNRRQASDVARLGPRQRSRGQCALTHFDEAGVLIVLRDVARVAAWDAHDWGGLFLDLQPDAFAIAVPGHALLEHGLCPPRLPTAKAVVFIDPRPAQALDTALEACAARIASGELLADPQELRPLPLAGLPGWHPGNSNPTFLRGNPEFQPRPVGRSYPVPQLIAQR